MKLTLLFTTLFLCTSCTLKSTESKTRNTHTIKLKKNLNVNFASISSLNISMHSELKNGFIRVIGVDSSKNKVILKEEKVSAESRIELSTDLNLESYKLIVATLTAKDLNGNKAVDVSTYKVNEQEEIDNAKKTIRTLRK